MSDDIPQWAMRAFCDRANLAHDLIMADKSSVAVTLRSAIRAGAQLIAEHEQPPVDPLLIEARQLAGNVMANFEADGQRFASGAINAVRTGNDDDSIQVQAALDGLRRGLQLAAPEAPQ